MYNMHEKCEEKILRAKAGYSYHIPSFQSYIWISPKAGFWYERRERRGVVLTLKDGVQFEKNVLGCMVSRTSDEFNVIRGVQGRRPREKVNSRILG